MDYKPLISYLKPTSSYLNSVALRGSSRDSSTKSPVCESKTCSNRFKSQRQSPPQSKTIMHPCLTSKNNSSKLDL